MLGISPVPESERLNMMGVFPLEVIKSVGLRVTLYITVLEPQDPLRGQIVGFRHLQLGIEVMHQTSVDACDVV